MVPNKNGEKELFGTVQPRADAAFVYANWVDIIVGQLSATDVKELDDLVGIFMGSALRKLCPYSEQCDNEGPCESYSCKFSRFIFECCYMVIGQDLRKEWSSFVKMYVRRLHEQTPFLVDFQIRNTEDSQADEKDENIDE